MLTKEQIEQIAVLAKLGINDNTDKLAKDLDSILSIIDELQNIDTSKVEPMSHPFDSIQRLRMDEITESDNRELYQQNAPLIEKGHYLVPRVL